MGYVSLARQHGKFAVAHGLAVPSAPVQPCPSGGGIEDVDQIALGQELIAGGPRAIALDVYSHDEPVPKVPVHVHGWCAFLVADAGCSRHGYGAPGCGSHLAAST